MIKKKKEKNRSFDFLCVFLKELQENGIIKFSLSELEKDLYLYSQNPKYKDIFFDMEYQDNKIILEKAIILLRDYRYIISLDYNLDIQYIVKPIEIKQNDLIRQLAMEYILREKIYRKNRIKIYGINPNNNYILVSGLYRRKNIEWNVITDGNVLIDNVENKEEIDFKNPKNPNELITIKKVNIEKIKIEEATYVLEQGLINNNVEVSYLYTDILDESKLANISNYTKENNDLGKRLVIKKF